ISYVEPSLHLCDKAYLTMVNNVFDVFFESVCQYFMSVFAWKYMRITNSTDLFIWGFLKQKLQENDSSWLVRFASRLGRSARDRGQRVIASQTQEFKEYEEWKQHFFISECLLETVQRRLKYEHDAIQRTEDLEEAKKKLAIRLQEAAEAMEVTNARNASLERDRHRLQLELGEILSDLQKARSVAAALELKQLHSDKALAAWKQKQEAQELLWSLNTEVLTLRHVCEERIEAQETLRRQNQDFQGVLRICMYRDNVFPLEYKSFICFIGYT
ncbi:hypothetical protein STEG23_025726, partial [Scotinomys teguina]